MARSRRRRRADRSEGGAHQSRSRSSSPGRQIARYGQPQGDRLHTLIDRLVSDEIARSGRISYPVSPVGRSKSRSIRHGEPNYGANRSGSSSPRSKTQLVRRRPGDDSYEGGSAAVVRRARAKALLTRETARERARDGSMPDRSMKSRTDQRDHHNNECKPRPARTSVRGGKGKRYVPWC